LNSWNKNGESIAVNFSVDSGSSLNHEIININPNNSSFSTSTQPITFQTRYQINAPNAVGGFIALYNDENLIQTDEFYCPNSTCLAFPLDLSFSWATTTISSIRVAYLPLLSDFTSPGAVGDVTYHLFFTNSTSTATSTRPVFSAIPFLSSNSALCSTPVIGDMICSFVNALIYVVSPTSKSVDAFIDTKDLFVSKIGYNEISDLFNSVHVATSTATSAIAFSFSTDAPDADNPIPAFSMPIFDLTGTAVADLSERLMPYFIWFLNILFILYLYNKYFGSAKVIE